MNILIVEDEQLALDDLLGMLAPLAANHSVIGCTSAAEALDQATRCPPDLVITDIRMPGINGIELIRRLKARNLGLAAIVLSGHSEFEYARESMRLSVTDYLLKPVRTDALLQTVSGALAALAAERTQGRQLREARLVRLLLGARADQADHNLLAGTWGMIFVVCENWESSIVWRDTALDREALAAMVASEGPEPWEVIGIDGHIRVLLAPIERASLHALDAAATRLHRSIVAAGLVAHTTYALKGAAASPAAVVSESMRRLALGMRFANPTFVRPDLMPEATGSSAREQLRLAERALTDGKLAVAADQAHAALAQLQQDGARQMTISEILDGLFQLFQRYAKQPQAQSIPDRSALVALLRRLRSYDELAAWVDLQLQPILEQERGSITPRQLVRTLVARVQDDCASNISLQTFAAEHGVSLAYFSRLFKDEVGRTFSDYLTQVRIERAKQLLARGDLRPGEISALVGYEDPKYFGQIFRRATGMSPLDFQRSRV